MDYFVLIKRTCVYSERQHSPTIHWMMRVGATNQHPKLKKKRRQRLPNQLTAVSIQSKTPTSSPHQDDTHSAFPSRWGSTDLEKVCVPVSSGFGLE